jgi:hypothetical protein
MAIAIPAAFEASSVACALPFAVAAPHSVKSAGELKRRKEEKTMHDIDRTQLEHDIDRTQLEAGAYGASEFGEAAEIGEEETEAGLSESPLTEAQEIELASEFLEASNEAELEHFLGNVFKTVGSAVGRFVRSDTGRALGGILKGAARQALPIVGGAVGQWISPRRGRAIGADIANQAGRLFGLELEGLSAEDREFEVARQFVRFAGTAAKQAAVVPPTLPPVAAAQRAAAAAARVYAPGLLRRLQGRSTRLWPHSGRWVRRGRTIVLFGGE